MATWGPSRNLSPPPGTPHDGHSSGVTTEEPPASGTCHSGYHLHGHQGYVTTVATALGTPHHCAYQLLGHSYQHQCLGTLHHGCHSHQLWGHLSTGATSRDPSPGMCHSPGTSPGTCHHLPDLGTLCPPKHWDLGVTWSCAGCHCHHSDVPTSQLGAAGIPRSHRTSPVPTAHRRSHHPRWHFEAALSSCLSLEEKFGGGK